MFGKKKAPLPEGIRLMHYEGLPGFAQDAPCLWSRRRRRWCSAGWRAPA